MAICALRLTLHSPVGHGSLPIRGGAMARLGRVPGALDRRRMPIRIIPLVDRTLIAMAAATRPPVRQVLGLLRRPRLSDLVIRLFGRRLAPLAAMLRTTVSPTMVRGGAAINGV